MTSASPNMMNYFRLLCICIAFSPTVLCYAQTALQDDIFIAPETLILDSAPVVVEIESQPTFETITTHSDFSEPIIVERAEEAAGGEQCVVVKKSILGCLEGITVLPQLSLIHI